MMHAIDALAFSVSGIFVPVFLLSSGLSVREVVIYFIVHNIILLAASLAVGVLAERIGLKRTIVIRYPFLFVFLGILVYWENFGQPLYLLALASGLQAGFFWAPVNILFGRYARKHDLGESIAKLSAFPKLAGLAGPAIGGVIAAFLGFQSLFVLTFVIAATSFIPLSLSLANTEKFRFRPKEGLKYFRKRPRMLAADIVDNIGGETEGVIWPIFVFLAAADALSVGYVGTLAALGSFFFTLFVGKQSDKHSERKLIRLAVPFLLLVWMLRTVFAGPALFYLSSLIAGFLLALFAVPYTRLLFAGAKEERNESFFIMKEVPTVIGRLIIFGLMFLFADHLAWLFPIAGLSYLYFLFL